ncbi:MAG: TniQ family protein [Xenococcaceae cyanobacterium MO_188.B32]|nr:TniQ family protein [Xenococcaceae cyanobacterium MO_188.B32]
MLGFFPTLYPSELLYSAIARYQIRNGNLSPKSNIEELFNSRNITATADLPCGLDNLVENLPPYSLVTADSLIQRHTLYRFYAPFLPPKNKYGDPHFSPQRRSLTGEGLLHLCLTLVLTQSRETTVCGLSSSQHQNQLNLEKKAIYSA